MLSEWVLYTEDGSGLAVYIPCVPTKTHTYQSVSKSRSHAYQSKQMFGIHQIPLIVEALWNLFKNNVSSGLI